LAHPKAPIQKYDVDSARSRLEDPQAWHKNITPERKRQQEIRRMVKDAKATVNKWETWKDARSGALAKLDALGATITRKDHKEDWQEEY
jgi:hypothetical protein